jgi:hypothetical protein
MNIANHVKITTKHPRGVSRGSNGLKLIQEKRSELRDGESINIGEKEREVSNGGGEVNGKSMWGGCGAQGGEKGVRPSSEDATGGTVKRGEMKAIEPMREETGKVEQRNVSELSLLKKNNRRFRRKQIHKDITTSRDHPSP